jgi:hypothetical protein
MNPAVDDLHAILSHLREDYAGYRDKTLGREAEFAAATAEAERRLDACEVPEEQTTILREWLRFFRDKHLGVEAAGVMAQFEQNVHEGTYDPACTLIKDDTVLFTIPSFALEMKEKIDRLVESNRGDITSRGLLLIDLRGNRGGSDYSGLSILPFLYTGPILIRGADVLSSSGNTEFYRGIARRPEWSEEIRAHFLELIARMEREPGCFVTARPDEEMSFDEILPRPERVGILIDGRCVSAGEQFLLYAKPSRKVVLFGSNTGGSLDYSNVRPAPLPSGARVLSIPITRSRRLPEFSVDAEGIAPNVPIPGGCKDPIAFVRAALQPR